MSTAQTNDYQTNPPDDTTVRRTNGQRSAAELERDIERHRGNLDRTLSELERKLSPGELLDEGPSYMKHGPGEFIGNLARSAKNNPVPMVLTGVGLAWLMLGDNEPAKKHAESSGRAAPEPYRESDELADIYASYLVEEYPFSPEEVEIVIYDDLGFEAGTAYSERSRRDKMRDMAAEWKEGARQSGQQVGDKAADLKHTAQDARDRASNKAGEFPDQARRSAYEIRAEAPSRIEAMRAKFNENSEDVKQRAQAARDRAMIRAREGRDMAARQARNAARQTSEFIDRYPLSLMALGIAAGAALGTAVPETRRENRLMGDASDALKGEALAQFEQEKQRAANVASAARDAAVDQARSDGLTAEDAKQGGANLLDRADRLVGAARAESERQGLTPEAARRQVDQTREKVERVAAAARDVAQEKGKRG